MTVEEIKAALKQLRIELSMPDDAEPEEPEIEDAWNAVLNAVIALNKYEKKAVLKSEGVAPVHGKVKPDE